MIERALRRLVADGRVHRLASDHSGQAHLAHRRSARGGARFWSSEGGIARASDDKAARGGGVWGLMVFMDWLRG